MQIAVPTPVENLLADPLAGSGAVAQAKALPAAQKVELLEAMMLQCPQVDVPLSHLFAHGVYMRMGTIPKGSFLVGHMHTTDHLNVLFSGRVSVLMNGEVTTLTGPCVFKADAGVRKLIYAHEDATLANVHGTHETDLDRIEDELIVKSDTNLSFHNGIKNDLMLLAESLGAALDQKEVLKCLSVQS